MSPLKLACFIMLAMCCMGITSALEGGENVCLKLIEHHCEGTASAQVMESCLNDNLLTCAKPPHCLQSSETGMCRAAFPRYYHNAASGECEEFIYGGCGGNSNNFNTVEECIASCAGIRYCGGNTGVTCPEGLDCAASEGMEAGTCVPATMMQGKKEPMMPMKEKKPMMEMPMDKKMMNDSP
jgi:Kunitz/Bovine pancreatic trypsin inhibitor domain